MNRAQSIYDRDLYLVYLPIEVAKLLNIKEGIIKEADNTLGIGKIFGSYRFTKDHIKKLKSYFNNERNINTNPI